MTGDTNAETAYLTAVLAGAVDRAAAELRADGYSQEAVLEALRLYLDLLAPRVQAGR